MPLLRICICGRGVLRQPDERPGVFRALSWLSGAWTRLQNRVRGREPVGECPADLIRRVEEAFREEAASLTGQELAERTERTNEALRHAWRVIRGP